MADMDTVAVTGIASHKLSDVLGSIASIGVGMRD